MFDLVRKVNTLLATANTTSLSLLPVGTILILCFHMISRKSVFLSLASPAPGLLFHSSRLLTFCMSFRTELLDKEALRRSRRATKGFGSTNAMLLEWAFGIFRRALMTTLWAQSSQYQQ
jgi:hypothetical protein